MKLPIDHICQKCSAIRKAGREMAPTMGDPRQHNRCGNVYDEPGSMMSYICGAELVPLRRVEGFNAKRNILVLEDTTPVLVHELHTSRMEPEAIVSVPGLPHLVFNVPQRFLVPTFEEVPHKVWTGEP